MPVLGMPLDIRPMGLRIFFNPMLWEFALGVLAYILWNSGRLGRWQRGFSLAFAVAVVAMAVLFALEPDLFTSHTDGTVDGEFAIRRVFLYGVPMFLLFGSVVGLREVGDGALTGLGRVLGDASYSIYLTHLAAVWGLSKILARFPIDADLAIAACVLVAAILGVITFRFVEKPMLDRSRALLRSRRVAPVGSSTT